MTDTERQLREELARSEAKINKIHSWFWDGVVGVSRSGTDVAVGDREGREAREAGDVE